MRTFLLKNNHIFQLKIRRMALLSSSTNLSDTWLNRSQLDSHVCSCVQSVVVSCFDWSKWTSFSLTQVCSRRGRTWWAPWSDRIPHVLQIGTCLIFWYFVLLWLFAVLLFLLPAPAAAALLPQILFRLPRVMLPKPGFRLSSACHILQNRFQH